jgi:pimeloyl-ACP methyl ester carboxylesterase
MNKSFAEPATNRQFLMMVLLSLLFSHAPSIASEASPLTSCHVAGFRSAVQCGTVRRALDPSQPNGVQIDVHYLVVPAMARRKLPDPVFFLAGGPGQSAMALGPGLTRLSARLNNRRDLVFVDQRGTGKSAPLACDDDPQATLAQQLDPQRRNTQLRQCLAQLQKLPYGDLRFFTTTLAMQDVDAVRQALGAPTINLVGGSYGTRAALEYLRQFPQAVRRGVMDGIAPPDMALPGSGSLDNQAVLDALFASCDNEAACAKAYPQLRADWAALLAQLPKPVQVVHPLDGKPEALTLNRDMVVAALRGPLYAPAQAAALPFAITQAARGRFDALMGLGYGLASRGASKIAAGLHFSVVCAEDQPRMATSTDKPGQDFGTAVSQLYADTCAYWPRGVVPEAFYTVPVSVSPLLLFSGGLDPVTPVRHGDRMAKALGSNALHVVVPNAGHGVMTLDCMRDVLFRFIDAPDDAAALAVDASCAKNIPRPGTFVPVARAGAGAP